MAVYFIHNPDLDRVKIGFTAGPVYKRLRQLQTSASAKLAIIAVGFGSTWGSARTEALLHRFLAALKLEGEWFSNSEKLRQVAECFSDYTDFEELDRADAALDALHDNRNGFSVPDSLVGASSLCEEAYYVKSIGRRAPVGELIGEPDLLTEAVEMLASKAQASATKHRRLMRLQDLIIDEAVSVEPKREKGTEEIRQAMFNLISISKEAVEELKQIDTLDELHPGDQFGCFLMLEGMRRLEKRLKSIE